MFQDADDLGRVYLEARRWSVQVVEGADQLAWPGLRVVGANLTNELVAARLPHRDREPLWSLRTLEFGPVFLVPGSELDRIEDHEDVGHHHPVQVVGAGKKPRLADHAGRHYEVSRPSADGDRFLGGAHERASTQMIIWAITLRASHAGWSLAPRKPSATSNGSRGAKDQRCLETPSG